MFYSKKLIKLKIPKKKGTKTSKQKNYLKLNQTLIIKTSKKQEKISKPSFGFLSIKAMVISESIGSIL